MPFADPSATYPDAVSSRSTLLPEPIARQWPEHAPALREALDMLFPHSAEITQSRLTRSGRPLEFAFVWPDGRPRFTTDVAPEETATARRKRSIEQSGFDDDDVVRRIAGWQLDPAGWGAWVGARSRAGDPSYKLYLDIAKDAPWRELERDLALHLSSSVGGTMTMAGIDQGGGSLEVYYRLPRLYADQIPSLLTGCDLPERSRELVNALERLIGYGVRNGIPSSNLGCSYAVSGGKVRAFTLYSYATSLLGPDDQVRGKVLRFCSAEGWDASAYEELTHPYLTERRHWSAHGMVGFVVDTAGSVHFTIGLSTGKSS